MTAGSSAGSSRSQPGASSARVSTMTFGVSTLPIATASGFGAGARFTRSSPPFLGGGATSTGSTSFGFTGGIGSGSLTTTGGTTGGTGCGGVGVWFEAIAC